ncbi:MAG: YtxH domain-containing protein [Bryobacterales bacterium]|jgi:gas vesicle protein|nr:YtxH domain-containing protein [Bryobacterales bacterium]
MPDSNHGLGYFIVGLGVGVAVGMLMAPKSGEETRRILREKADEGRDYMKHRVDEGRDYVVKRSSELRETATGAVERGKDVLHRQKEQLSSAIDAGKQAYHESMGEGHAR